MKALLYKEFKLAMHPICYIFIALFPLMVLIPDGGYPKGVAFIYLFTCYPVLFLGANKGQQSNDLLYSTLLPIRKKDIVLARIMTVAIMQFAFMAIMSALSPLAILIQSFITVEDASLGGEAAKALAPVGLGINAFPLLLAIAIIGFSIADLIFFPIYYKNGKSIVMSTLFTIFGFVFYIAIFTIVVPYIIGIERCNSIPLWIQFVALAGSLIIYALLHLFVYKISSKRLERVDF